MKGMARVVVMGNLTRDPELRSTGGGTSVCSLSVAVNERRKVQGEWEEYVSFYDVTVFGNSAESTAQYLAKGSPVAVDGRLTQDRWEKDGQKRSAVQIIADQVNWLPDGRDSSERSAAEPDEEKIPF